MTRTRWAALALAVGWCVGGIVAVGFLFWWYCR